MNLYSLYYDDGNGDRNLFVWAHDPDEAVDLWRRYYEDDSGELPEQIILVPTTPPDSPKVLKWYDDMVEVTAHRSAAVKALGV